jgi:methylated-DNA-[protein]-cysteine S-methyltransferase
VTDRSSACVRIEPDLVAVAAGEGGGDALRRAEAHTARCGGCRDRLDQYRAIERALTGVRAAAPPVALVAASRERLESRLLDLRSRLLHYRIVSTPLGGILLARSEQGVALVEYLDRGTTARALATRRLGGLELVEGGAEESALARDLEEYLHGRLVRLDWPLDFRLARSGFQRAVLEATAAVPYGAVVSYTGVAREIGRPAAVRAVAQALRWNPVPIVVPCHRVVGRSGALTGYAGSRTDRKRTLLALEGVPVVRAHGDLEVARGAMYVRMPGDPEYCLPSCPSVESLTANTPVFFASRERAEAAGLAPCTTCRPDLRPLVPRALP